MGSVVDELTRPPAVREKLAGNLPAEDTPYLGEHLQANARHDPEQRFLRVLGWLIDGCERARDGTSRARAPPPRAARWRRD